MDNMHDNLQEFHDQLKKGAIQQAYRFLLEYIMRLRNHFQKTLPGYDVPGNIYQGYMDMTYFSIIPPTLKQHRLKIAVVFLYDAFRFEVWLSGYNRQVQAKYWQVFRNHGSGPYRLVDDPLKADSILEHILVEEPDFNDLDELTRRIERGSRDFITDMENFLTTSGC